MGVAGTDGGETPQTTHPVPAQNGGLTVYGFQQRSLSFTDFINNQNNS